MTKVMGIVALLMVSACTEEKKTEQVIMPNAQLQALQKAKNIEAELLKAQQTQDQKFKEQGL